MKIYVACAYKHKEEAKNLMNKLEAHGHEITYDWTSIVEESVNEAVNDINGVGKCSTVVVFASTDCITEGVLIEIGVAIAKHKRILVFGDLLSNHLYGLLPEIKWVDNIDELLTILSGMEWMIKQ